MAHQGYYTNPSNIKNVNDALVEVEASKKDAETAATNASLFADQAGLYNTQAEAYASNALASANSASNSKISAANHSQNAQNSAASAAADATLATQYADNSQAYSIQASAYRDDALAFRNQAEVYKDSAAASAASIDPANFLLKANNLSDIPSPSTARTSLGLGTAATATVTTSSTDTTAGRLVKVGDFGANGGDAVQVSSGSCNALVTSGLYNATAATTDRPGGAASGSGSGYFIQVLRRSATSLTQRATINSTFTAYAVGTPTEAFRSSTDNGATWASWVTLAEDTGWLTPSLVNSWTDLENFRYRRLNGVVYISGKVSKSTTPTVGEVITTLPVGFRPQATSGIVTRLYGSNLSFNDVDVNISTIGELKFGFYGFQSTPAPTTPRNMIVNFSYPVGG